jgi:hypothetical protein
LDQYSGTENGRRGKEAVAASVDHASSRVVKKKLLAKRGRKSFLLEE